MDTKLKKFKKISGLLCFFTGMTLLLGGIFSMASGFMNYRYSPARIQELVNGDYQDTEGFRTSVSSRLADFLSMATGAPVGAYYWYGYYQDWDWQYEKELEEKIEQELMQGNTGANVMEGYGDSWYEDEWRGTTPEQNKKMADRLHAGLEKNKNLLYTISYDGKVLYSNTDGLTLDGSSGIMPEGYNFLLYFNGREVKIVKDGQEIDVYGDGYYRDESDWYVPGYVNFTINEEMQKAQVCIAVAQTPERYIYSQSGQHGYRQAEDGLYWIQQNMEVERTHLVVNIILLAAGVLLLALSHFVRSSKKEGEEAVAHFLSRIWLEVKIVLGVAALFLFVLGRNAAGVYRNALESVTIVTQELQEISAYEGTNTYMLSELFREYIRVILTEPSVLILLFWLIYLAALDIRKNKKIWKHSLTAKAADLFAAKEMELPFARKLVRRCIPGAAAGALLCVTAVLAAALGNNMLLLLLSIVVSALAAGIVCFYMVRTRQLAADMDMLAQRIAAIHGGRYEGGGEIPVSQDLKGAFAELEDIRQGMSKAIDEQVKSQRMKVELIANVSHDIKTPLTSIISYVEFLKQEEGLPEHVKDYISILDEKSQRLKNMVQDVFAVSKAASGQLTVNMEQLDLGKLLRQTMADMEEQIRSSSVTVKAEIPETPVMIEADGQKLYRVFQNLIQNALKYSLEGSRVYITTKTDGGLAVASVKNTSRFEIDQDKDFTERFVRGDESRTDGGSGLGLSIARNFTEACGGSFSLETIADLFLVTVSFKTIS